MNIFLSRASICAAISSSFLLVIGGRLAVADEAENWRVEKWGEIQTVYQFLDSDSRCPRDGISSSSFQAVSYGNGSAELVFSTPLKANHAYHFTAWIWTAKPASVDIFFRRVKFPYDATSIVSKKVAGWNLIELKGIHTSPGDGAIRIAIKEDNVLLCVNSPRLAEIVSSEVGAPQFLSTVNPPFFGIHLNQLGMHNGWPNFDPGTMRLWDSGTTWAELQPINAPIEWDKNPNARRLDYYISHGRSKRPDIQFIYTLGMTPRWAGRPHPDNCFSSSYGPSICTMPSDLEYWRNYVSSLAVRYKGIIQIWELWNEADLRLHWDQTPEDMVLLAGIASQVLKSIDPLNQLIGPNITVGGMRFLSHFLNAGGAAYIDGVSIHANPNRMPHRSFQQIRNLRRLLESMGLGAMTVWNTEPKVTCKTFLDDCSVSYSADGNFYMNAENSLAQAIIGNAALNVRSFVYYTWEGSNIDVGNAALTDESYKVPTRAGLTYATVKDWISNAIVFYTLINHAGLNTVEVHHGKKRSLIAWSSAGPETIDLTDYPELNQYMLSTEGISLPVTTAKMKVGNDPMIFFNNPLDQLK